MRDQANYAMKGVSKGAPVLAEGVQRRRLGNGLTVLLREDHSTPIVTTMVWYRVGSRHESLGATGISHFLEHMMFKGSRRFPKGEIDHLTTRRGGANNAFTSHDYTAFYFSFASDRWWLALEIEADRMRHNRFDPEEFELERKVILEEMKMELDDPWEDLRQAVDRRAFQTHPYRYPVIGLQEDLIALSLARVVEHYQSFYSPSNAILTVVGDFGTMEALDRIENLFGPLESPPHPRASRNSPDRLTGGEVVLHRPSHLPRMLAAFPAPSVHDEEHYVVQVLDRLLAGGKLSRLYRRLVDQENQVSVVAGEFDEMEEPYLFFLRLELQERVTPDLVKRTLSEELDRLRERPVAQAELERAKRQCVVHCLSDFETTLDQAVQLGLMETLRGFEYWNDYCGKIAKVASENVLEAARHLSPEQAIWGILTDGSGV
jgi:zinc protease